MKKFRFCIIISIILIVVIFIASIIILKNYNVNTNKPIIDNGIAKLKDTVKVIPKKEINDEQILMTLNSESLYNINVADNVELANKSDIIIIGTIQSIDGFVNYNSKYDEYVFPRTVGKVKVNKVIKGDLEYDEIPFMRMGGTITISDYEKTLLPSQISKRGFNNLTEEEKNNNYVTQKMSEDIEIEEGKTYLMYLKYNQDYGCYIISYQKYGLREIDTNIESSNQAILNSNTRTIQSSEYSTIKVKDNENGEWVTLDSLIPSQYKK